MKPIPGDAIQCAAQRPISGPNAMYGVLRCYEFDGHKGPHNDAVEGVTWRATRLGSVGHITRAYHEGE